MLKLYKVYSLITVLFLWFMAILLSVSEQVTGENTIFFWFHTHWLFTDDCPRLMTITNMIFVSNENIFSGCTNRRMTQHLIFNFWLHSLSIILLMLIHNITWLQLIFMANRYSITYAKHCLSAYLFMGNWSISTFCLIRRVQPRTFKQNYLTIWKLIEVHIW